MGKEVKKDFEYNGHVNLSMFRKKKLTWWQKLLRLFKKER